MNVNGFSTVSHTSTSGTFTSSTHSSGTPHLRSYDCLWDYAQFQPAGAGGLKDGSPSAAPFPSLAPFPLNGVAGGSRPASPGHGANLRGSGQELWGNGTPGSMGLNFDSQELYDSFHDQNFELMPNGPASFYTAAVPHAGLWRASLPAATRGARRQRGRCRGHQGAVPGHRGERGRAGGQHGAGGHAAR